MNYYELFNLPVELDIDQATLKAQSLKLQQQYHPDRVEDKNFALIKSSEINQAYNTLSQIDSRAGYLLKLVQQDQGLEQSIHDFDFLQSALDLRERLDDAQSAEQLSALKQEIRQHIVDLSQDFKTQYHAKTWDAAQETVRKLQFFQRVLNDIDKAEERLLDDFDLNDDF
ncbi:Fe-S protein assembly co-chaperone HscB [Acinetobacter apis]|uniref:Co-chaperone protein HscB homolog n=1 Tax=Acinetobacter apis TaxID=1229165 RepID=A0A217EDG6_9GAMM|nr:Fe-S protein assembly co-chaperone HscB [Acinetobacter apis]SNQ28533.1 Co-chaperone protein HscB [Acinetobacter apis]